MRSISATNLSQGSGRVAQDFRQIREHVLKHQHKPSAIREHINQLDNLIKESQEIG